ncbi:hypothetical protein [Paenibacillus sp. 1001270B_150601_E10]|uniref:hypothetical protein n=1 Tax=Paenibacillus sp. 1001270B_150601_E10 TaxID=2787079 RepID=UPI00189EC358|nr:hypothetical protein [Paenibacillus sp. 1001270B_150601_E10]
MARKYVEIFLLFLIVSMVFSNSVFAESSNDVVNQAYDLSDLKINYDLDLGHHGKTKSELISQFLNDGLTEKEAEYYAKLDILANQLTLKGKKIDISKGELTKEYIVTHQDELRERALNLDEDAIVSLFHTNLALTTSKDEISRELKKMDGTSGVVTFKYPDGSSSRVETSTIKVDDRLDYETNGTIISGPWGDNIDLVNQEAGVSSSGTYVAKTDLSFKGSTHYGKINDTYTFQILNNGSTDMSKWTGKYISDTGASSGGGFVLIDTEYLSNHQRETATASTYMQGYTDVLYRMESSVSGSITLYYASLSFSVTGGSYWHEYAIYEVDGDGQTPIHMAGYFK